MSHRLLRVVVFSFFVVVVVLFPPLPMLSVYSPVFGLHESATVACVFFCLFLLLFCPLPMLSVWSVRYAIDVGIFCTGNIEEYVQSTGNKTNKKQTERRRGIYLKN